MNLSLVSSPGCRPQWNVSGGLWVQGNESTVSMYSISKLGYLYNTSEHEVMNIQLLVLFSRRYEAFLLTTFLPCFFLAFLSVLTLTHFQLDGFTDRITVTLSLLIVIASLFSQLSSTLPTAPTTKLVDYFFLFCIIKVGCVFILHSFIGKSLRNCQKKEEAEDLSYASKDNLITMKDPALDINMKIAWMNGARKDPPKKSRFNIPSLVNNLGFGVVILVDILIISYFCYWAISAHRTKQNMLDSFKFTETFRMPYDS